VFVPKLGVRAKVLEAPSRGQLRVAAGTMKITVSLGEITSGGPAPPAHKPAKKPAPAPLPRIERAPVRTDSITCDVRGLRVDEAVDRVEGFVDLMLSEGEPVGFVLHGHGTGALKSALRDHLTAHRFVAKARAADEDQGGDAFTVFWTAD
jgi:DNA mismatch repair protein MutS2